MPHDIRPEYDHLRHPKDPRVMVADCMASFNIARDAGFHAAILKRPAEEKHRMSELVSDVTARHAREDIEGHDIVCLNGNFDGLGLFRPLEDIFEQMHASMYALTGRISYYLLPLVNFSRAQDNDPKGTGHKHDFHVMNVVVNGHRGTGWISPSGEELAAESGDWMYLGAGFSHFATTEENDAGRITFVLNH